MRWASVNFNRSPAGVDRFDLGFFATTCSAAMDRRHHRFAFVDQWVRP